MNSELTVITERVDDIPLLLKMQERMGIADLIDRHFPAHGNRRGLSLGQLGSVWLAHILSQADHRLNHVRPWAAELQASLQACIGEPVSELDFTDDRLADLLTALADDERWGQFEADLNQQTLRVYDLQARLIRLDSTTASGYWEITDQGLFQVGHSKDHQSGHQPQVKIMAATLDPLGLPLVTQVVAGHRSDDPLYIPAIQQVHQSLSQPGLLFVGDCKLASRDTRAFIQQAGDYYLAPLSKVQLPDEVLAGYLAAVGPGQPAWQLIQRPQPDGTQQAIAQGFEVAERLQVEWNAQTVTWTERRWVVQSFQRLHRERTALQERLERAQVELERMNQYRPGRKIYHEIEPVQVKVAEILERHQVVGLLQVQVELRSTITSPKGQPRPVVWVQVEQDAAAVEQRQARLGWRVYASNHPLAGLSLEDAVLAYRDEYIVEHFFGRLKGKPLSVSPMYLQDDQRATGLIRLLSLGVRTLTLLEFGVRRRLAQEQAHLAGVYAGSPTRATPRPSAELLLEAFDKITLSVVKIGEQVHYHLTPLNATQQQILSLLDLSLSVYLSLAEKPSRPP